MTLVNSSISNNEHGVHILGSGGELKLIKSTVADNEAGGITSSGIVNILDSTLSGNGGSIGAVDISEGTATIVNSTISGNSRGVEVGGVFGDADATLKNVAIVDNGFGLVSGYYGGIAAIENSLFAFNGTSCAGYEEFDDLGGNLDDDASCPSDGDLTGLDSELSDNGGPTLTHALLPGSSAIDAAGDCGLAADQRGFVRSDGLCDSGPFELGAEPAGIVLTFDGACPGRGTLTLTGGTPQGAVAVGRSERVGTTVLTEGSCAGTELGLDSPRLLAQGLTDATGSRSETRTLSEDQCGSLLQALDLTTCAVGDVLHIP